MKIIRYCITFALIFTLLACSKMAQDNEMANMSEQALYNMAERALADGEYQTAVDHFEALDAQYPFGQYAEQAMLDSIYAYYKNGEKSQAAATAKRYIHLYPRSRKVDYAYYMRGLANFEQNHGILTRYVPFDEAQRDPGTSLQAYNEFRSFIKRFPRSAYVADARQRLIYLRNLFAKKELTAAKFYYRRKAYVAAVNRANYLLQQFPQSPQAEQALIVAVQANRHLGLKKEADEALQVLKLNYPDSRAIRKLTA